MIDFHTHILPEMDDGSRGTEESVQMLKMMQQQGIDTVVATPHFDMRQESPQEFLRRRQTAYEQLSRANDTGVSVICGAEVLYCGISLRMYEGLESLCIGNGRYLLTETLFPEWNKEFRDDLVYLMMERNIIPILAHIERYYFIGKNRRFIHELAAEGAVLQMNAEAFLMRKTARKAWKILRKEPVGLIASDCHGTAVRPPNLGEAAERMTEVLGTEVVSHLRERADGILHES